MIEEVTSYKLLYNSLVQLKFNSNIYKQLQKINIIKESFKDALTKNQESSIKIREICNKISAQMQVCDQFTIQIKSITDNSLLLVNKILTHIFYF